MLKDKSVCPHCGDYLISDLHLTSPEGKGFKVGLMGIGIIKCRACGASWCDCCGDPLEKENTKKIILSKWKQPLGIFRRIIRVEEVNKPKPES